MSAPAFRPIAKRHYPHSFHTCGGQELPGYASGGVARTFCDASLGAFLFRDISAAAAAAALLSALPCLAPLLLLRRRFMCPCKLLLILGGGVVIFLFLFLSNSTQRKLHQFNLEGNCGYRTCLLDAANNNTTLVGFLLFRRATK